MSAEKFFSEDSRASWKEDKRASLDAALIFAHGVRDIEPLKEKAERIITLCTEGRESVDAASEVNEWIADMQLKVCQVLDEIKIDICSLSGDDLADTVRALFQKPRKKVEVKKETTKPIREEAKQNSFF